jgi:hypothetical protein
MSLPDLDPRFDDLVRELRGARPQPPAALAERVARIADAPAAPRRELRWRRPALVLVPVATLALAGIGASLLLGKDSPNNVAVGSTAEHAQALKTLSGAAVAAQDTRRGFVPSAAPARKAATNGTALAPAPFRATEEHASFTLQVDDRNALGSATQQAMRIVRALGGYVVTAQTAQPGDGQGDSTLTVRVPIGHVQQAIARLSALGHILSQDIQLQDLQAPINRQRDRMQQLGAAIGLLEHELATQPLAVEARSRVETQLALDRAQLAAAQRAAAALAKRGRLATIDLSLTTRHSTDIAPPAHPGQAQRTLTRAWHLLGRELAYVAAGLLLLAPLAVIAALAVLVRRTWRRREEARLLAASR